MKHLGQATALGVLGMGQMQGQSLEFGGGSWVGWSPVARWDRVVC